MDARMRTSEVIGPLHGIPVVVKDQVETSDMPTTYGSTLFRDFVPARDATVVRRLRGAGAVILAKTTMGELAAGYAGGAFGACRNAYDPSRDPSGSSSGSGVAVAANLAMLAVGEDTLGGWCQTDTPRQCVASMPGWCGVPSQFGCFWLRFGPRGPRDPGRAPLAVPPASLMRPVPPNPHPRR